MIQWPDKRRVPPLCNGVGHPILNKGVIFSLLLSCSKLPKYLIKPEGSNRFWYPKKAKVVITSREALTKQMYSLKNGLKKVPNFRLFFFFFSFWRIVDLYKTLKPIAFFVAKKKNK